MQLLALVLASFLVTPLLVLVVRAGLSWFTALLPAALFAGFAALLPEVSDGTIVLESHRWISSLGLEFSFRLDGLALLFALLITGIGTLIFLYASRYMVGRPDQPRFFAYLAMFMGSMLGAVLSDDLITLVVFWELTSLTSFMLIGYEPENEQSRRSAQQGLLMTVAGGLALLAGMIILGQAAGSFRIAEILAQGPALAGHPHAPAIIVLLAIGAFAKSAQAPLHSWLPNAMVAPTPVSAFLHSATMVKLGVYLLARFDPVFGAHPWWSVLLVGAGLLTMLTGTVLAMRETDLKRVLAYSTVVSLGTLVTLVGLPNEVAATAMVTFLLVHALYKACLFMIAGIIDHEIGTRDASKLSGLARAMPATAGVALMGGMSMAGLPPFVGFVGKELIYEAGLQSAWPWIPVGIGLLANACMVVVAGIVTIRCFFGPPGAAVGEDAHDPPLAMMLGPLMLSLLGLLFGLMPGLAAPLLGPAASSLTGQAVSPSLALWHGLTPMLLLSVLTLIVGVVAFWRWMPLRKFLADRKWIEAWGPDAGYDHLMSGLSRLAVWQTRIVQSGSLRRYVVATFGVIAAASLGTLVSQGGLAFPALDSTSFAPELVLPLLLIVASLAVLRANTFMKGIVAAGMVGFGVALVFLFRGAPDLAFTQFSVEALAVVILLAIVGRLPFHEQDPRGKSERRFDAIVAILFGSTAALILLAAVAGPFNEQLSDFFRAASVPQAHGRNLVNVIIVDFRALDTLGEITVLAVAALAAASVIACVRMDEPRHGVGRARPDSLIFRVCGYVMLPAAITFSLFLLWRGHNEPGGGFVGGVIAAAGCAVYVLPRGREALAKLLRVSPRTIAGFGLLAAAASGVFGLAAGDPFLTHQWMFFDSGLALGSALLFDIGVYLAVLGSVLTFLEYYLEA